MLEHIETFMGVRTQWETSISRYCQPCYPKRNTPGYRKGKIHDILLLMKLLIGFSKFLPSAKGFKAYLEVQLRKQFSVFKQTIKSYHS